MSKRILNVSIQQTLDYTVAVPKNFDVSNERKIKKLIKKTLKRKPDEKSFDTPALVSEDGQILY